MGLMKIYFVTGNPGKFNEVKECLEEIGVEVEQIKIDKPEIKSDDIVEIAEDAAKKLASELNKAIVVDDTGVFFETYENFPGAHPKFVINSIGYEGIFRLLEGKNRSAYFMTAAAYADPEGNVKSFTGKQMGRISEEIKGNHIKGFPYDSIFVPEGHETCLAEMKEKKASHRTTAFLKLAKWLINRKL